MSPPRQTTCMTLHPTQHFFLTSPAENEMEARACQWLTSFRTAATIPKCFVELSFSRSSGPWQDTGDFQLQNPNIPPPSITTLAFQDAAAIDITASASSMTPLLHSSMPVAVVAFSKGQLVVDSASYESHLGSFARVQENILSSPNATSLLAVNCKHLKKIYLSWRRIHHEQGQCSEAPSKLSRGPRRLRKTQRPLSLIASPLQRIPCTSNASPTSPQRLKLVPDASNASPSPPTRPLHCGLQCGPLASDACLNRISSASSASQTPQMHPQDVHNTSNTSPTYRMPPPRLERLPTAS
ncbi:hypothetical protein OG21DRAFT_278037 [Imleria badia]|nr:hypothetical protein OG21DRAFT_278037 [Imleria badia]